MILSKEISIIIVALALGAVAAYTNSLHKTKLLGMIKWREKIVFEVSDFNCSSNFNFFFSNELLKVHLDHKFDFWTKLHMGTSRQSLFTNWNDLRVIIKIYATASNN